MGGVSFHHVPFDRDGSLTILSLRQRCGVWSHRPPRGNREGGGARYQVFPAPLDCTVSSFERGRVFKFCPVAYISYIGVCA